MATLEKFRWIPMIIRAYQQAQLRMSSNTLHENPVELTDDQISAVSHNQPKKPKRHISNVSQHKSVKQRKSRSEVFAQNNHNANLLRELRATNRKLSRLESIHQQLREMENKFDGLSKYLQQSTNSKEHQSSNASVARVPQNQPPTHT